MCIIIHTHYNYDMHAIAAVSLGLQPVVIENVMEGDELRTDVRAIEMHLKRLGPENVVCVLTTTSCFAPRGCDRWKKEESIWQLYCPCSFNTEFVFSPSL